MILAHSSAALVVGKDTREFGRHTQATAHVTGAVAGKNPAQRKMGGFWVKQTTVRPLLLAFPPLVKAKVKGGEFVLQRRHSLPHTTS